MRLTRRRLCIAVGAAVLAAASLGLPPVRRLLHPVITRMRGTYTIEDRISQFTEARARVEEQFRRAGIAFPPARVVLLGLKDERRLEVYAGPAEGSLRLIATYPILAASGGPGPKLREGDRQVPEGVYALELLNPNSRFHVSLRVGYPSEFDRRMAAHDGRTNLGGDIMIHGGAASIGCLAMGDPAAEDLFILAAAAGIENVTIVLAPLDLRREPLPPGLRGGWRDELYATIRARLMELREGEAQAEP